MSWVVSAVMHSCVARAHAPAVSYLTGSNVRCSTVRLGVGYAMSKDCQVCVDTLLYKQACRAVVHGEQSQLMSPTAIQMRDERPSG